MVYNLVREQLLESNSTATFVVVVADFYPGGLDSGLDKCVPLAQHKKPMIAAFPFVARVPSILPLYFFLLLPKCELTSSYTIVALASTQN
jgi:hypothetical protein